MRKHTGHRPAAGRSVYVLGTTCGTLAVAAVVSAVYPVPYPTAQRGELPATSQDDVLSTLDDVWFPVDESAPTGGPLQVPDIGVVLEDYDERYSALEAARAEEAGDDYVPSSDDDADDARIPANRYDSLDELDNPVERLPAPPPAPVEPPVLGPPAPPPPAAPAVTDPAPTAPASPSTPPVAPPAPQTPTRPAPTTPPPTTPPTTPTEEPPPPPPPPADTTLALGERYEHTAADGTVDFTITLVSVEADIACAAGTVAAENGHLLGLHVEVADPTPAAEAEAPSPSAADFRFVGADDVVTADVDTAASAGCLENGWPDGRPGPDTPAAGTVVLDVPATTGTLVYRPADWTAGIRWNLPPAE
ncbi:hypothetical protein [Blastococcus litoris]|uniref:hypothetical protein n=1 Tax=Blastococcus litoris TaxID=2171622 RepID=UPI000E300971|nr:hypothetical protein [Blastococcus litoris]